jgi:hypothetical protein
VVRPPALAPVLPAGLVGVTLLAVVARERVLPPVLAPVLPVGLVGLTLVVVVVPAQARVSGLLLSSVTLKLLAPSLGAFLP